MIKQPGEKSNVVSDERTKTVEDSENEESSSNTSSNSSKNDASTNNCPNTSNSSIEPSTMNPTVSNELVVVPEVSFNVKIQVPGLEIFELPVNHLFKSSKTKF